ncbi:hypothetical protein [Geodermatophilus amargosae]|uniref:hypothetical protein n=1 Tax=Geodermatophilus amargosae TaxID=1296565 RepID=UPI0034DF9622
MPSPAHLVTGVFLGSHAVSAGDLTPRQLRSFRRVVQGVYADPALPLDHRLRCEAVALLLPPGAVLGGGSAAGWYGAPWPGPGDPATVLRPPDVGSGVPRARSPGHGRRTPATQFEVRHGGRFVARSTSPSRSCGWPASTTASTTSTASGSCGTTSATPDCWPPGGGSSA